MNNVEYSQNNVTNNKAVSTLTFGILSILIPIIGLVLSILGIVYFVKARKEMLLTNEAGSGLATAGLICSIVGIATQLFIAIGILAFWNLTSIAEHLDGLFLFN